MNEIIITLSDISPQDFFGLENSNIKFIRTHFPKLKIVARGNEIKAFGNEEMLSEFELRMEMLIQYYHRYNKLDEHTIERTLISDPSVDQFSDDIIVHGVGGKAIKAKTANQQKLVDAVAKNDLVFAVGPAGTGKTYISVALAVKALKEKKIKRIILTRPAVEAGENLGFLPGDLKEKLDPYMQPLYDGLRDMIPSEKLNNYIEKGIIQIAPMAFMRGRTLDHAFVILDESQNTTRAQMKMFLTRMGQKAKFVITGDPGQIDLPRRTVSGLKEALVVLKNIDGVNMVHLSGKDVVRHRLVKKVISAYKEIEHDNS